MELPPLEEPLDLARPWDVVEPEQVGLDAAALAVAGATLADEPRAMSLLVIRSGRLAYERYFRGNHADSLNDVRSVTKSVVSTLVGIAVKDGLIDNLDVRLDEVLPESFALTPAQSAIRLRHLLTMSGGFEWAESGATGYNEWISSPDHIAFLLDRPVVDPPGSTFTYNSAAVHLLGVVLEEATGERLPAFADRVLFGPLGIQRSRWEALFDGFHNAGSGLDLRPRDLARIGQLAIQGGLTGTRALTEPDWFERAGLPAFTFRFDSPGIVSGSYGYLWWTDTGRPQAAYLAWGYGGQFIYVVPGLDLVVVATTEWRGVGGESGAVAGRVLQVVTDGVLEAVR